jgi:hypothetical protein
MESAGPPQNQLRSPATDGRQGYGNSSHSNHGDVINSLGDALAGVNLSGSYLHPYENEVLNWSSVLPPSGAQYQQANHANAHQMMLQQQQQYAAQASRGNFSDGQRVLSQNTLLFGTDMNDLRGEPSTPERKQSLELFLSQSPSQTLGEEVLALQTLTHGTGGHARARPHELLGGGVKPRKSESPLGSVTATSASSGADSPSLFQNGGDHARNSRIQAYQSYDMSNPQQQRMNQGYGLSSQNNGMSNMGTDYMSMQHTLQQHQRMNQQPSIDPYHHQQHGAPQGNPAPPQVLYMAVPTPDGRGQMLQAVQMVTLPGQTTPSFMLPQGAIAVGQDGIQQTMMVMPTTMQQQTSQGGTLGGPTKVQNWSVAPQYSTSDNSNISSQYTVDNIGRDDYLTSPRHLTPGGGPPSPTLSSVNGADAIASLYAAPQRPPLDALLGHVRRLSRDQVGCRLLQQALDEEGAIASTLILNEGISFWGEAMVDPFGNYLFQKILEKITAEERIMLIKSVSARLVNASLNLHGTRSVQKVVELCAMDEAQFPNAKDQSDGNASDILTRALAPAAARLCIDSHGNHVIQRILLKLGHCHSMFVFDAVAASVGDVARHRHGCCVIQRCLDSPVTEARSHLVRRIVEKSLELMQDAYGNYVVQYVLDVCGDDDVHAVCESVAGKVCLLAIQKFSSNVMEKCLERCSDRVKEMYLSELSDSDRIRELMMDPFGNYVVQRALSVATHAQAVRLVEAMRPHLLASQPGAPHGQRNGGMRNTAGGRRIMAKICRRFPNFTLTAIGTPEELYSQNKGHNRKQHPHAGPGHGMAYPPQMSPQGHQPAPYGRGPPRGGPRASYYETGPPAYYDPMHNGHAAYPPHM